jgi:amino acid transporter
MPRGHDDEIFTDDNLSGSRPSVRYRRELARTLPVRGAVVLSLGIAAPAASVLVIGPVMFTRLGAGTLLALVIAAAVTGCLALCWAELGTRYPNSGGVYGLVARTLGNTAGLACLTLHITSGIVVASALALACAGAAVSLGVPASTRALALCFLGAGTLVAALRLRIGTAVAMFLLALELGGLLAVTVAGIARARRDLGDVLMPQSPGDGVAALPLSTTLGGVALGILGFAGYGAAVVFSEELRGARRGVARAVLWAAGITVVAVSGPLLAALLSARNVGELQTRTPFAVVLGPVTGTVTASVVVGVLVVAAFNALIAILMEFGRIIYSSARDGAWPRAVNVLLARVRTGSRAPAAATVAAAAVAATLTAASELAAVVSFGSVVLAVTFGLVALGTLVDRRRGESDPVGYRMPWWPLPPLLALGGVVVTVASQPAGDLVVVGAIAGIGAVYYYAYLRPRPDRWLLLAPVAFEE